MDQSGDGVFGKGNNLGTIRSAMRQDGGMCRFNEFRRAGWAGKNSVYLSMFGTNASFEEHGLSQMWTTLSHELTDVSNLIACKNHLDADSSDTIAHVSKDLQADFLKGTAKVHPVDRLPREFINQPNGHFGSHQFLVDDFVKSVATGMLPPNHAWNAAKYCAPGLIAYQSSLKVGEWLDIPDFGTPPSNWAVLDPYKL